ncbi:hypothetical protein PSV08DRAFT_373590 [Bipolaris maydis]|uniref:uncharacterized protein n=1 Tax=Cochliobolus heterostrophus TaxID=5016 RepID=UPI0024DCDA5C|nr:hypothetical protein PSV08DRAFT_373590 [Bipolaris maydis]
MKFGLAMILLEEIHYLADSIFNRSRNSTLSDEDEARIESYLELELSYLPFYEECEDLLQIIQPFSKVFQMLPECSDINGESLLKEIPNSKSIEKALEIWKKKGYKKKMLRAWVKDKVDVLLNKFNVLRGTLSNGKKVQLIIIPQHGRYGARKCGILSTVLSFYATHVIAFIGGTAGGHLYFEPTNQRIKRGWTFMEMEEGSRLRHIIDGKSARIADYEDIYMFALEDVNKSRNKLPNDWDESYTWLEKDRRIQNVGNNVPDFPKPRSFLLSKWVQDELQGHEDVIPSRDWRKRDEFKAKLDLCFGGYRKSLKYNSYSLL